MPSLNIGGLLLVWCSDTQVVVPKRPTPHEQVRWSVRLHMQYFFAVHCDAWFLFVSRRCESLQKQMDELSRVKGKESEIVERLRWENQELALRVCPRPEEHQHLSVQVCMCWVVDIAEEFSLCRSCDLDPGPCLASFWSVQSSESLPALVHTGCAFVHMMVFGKLHFDAPGKLMLCSMFVCVWVVILLVRMVWTLRMIVLKALVLTSVPILGQLLVRRVLAHLSNYMYLFWKLILLLWGYRRSCQFLCCVEGLFVGFGTS